MTSRPRIDVDVAPPTPSAAPIASSSSIDPLRKAAILLVSLEQPLASKLLAQLDRSTVEAVTLEIARLERIDRREQEAVLEEFHGLGVRRLRFGFDDLARLSAGDLRVAFLDDEAAAWALALAGSAQAVQSRLLEALEASSAQRLRAEVARVGAFRLTDAEAAQAEIIDRLRGLHDQGLITLPAPVGGEAMLV